MRGRRGSIENENLPCSLRAPRSRGGAVDRSLVFEASLYARAKTFIERCTAAKHHVGVAESCTGGLLAALAPRRGPQRVLDFMLRTGPHGEGFGAQPADR